MLISNFKVKIINVIFLLLLLLLILFFSKGTFLFYLVNVYYTNEYLDLCTRTTYLPYQSYLYFIILYFTTLQVIEYYVSF